MNLVQSLKVKSHINYIVITPVRDEVHYIQDTIKSMVAQSIRPIQWVIVDDGSTDGTSDLLDKNTKKYDWITVVHRGDRGFRAAGGGVVQAFNAGYEKVQSQGWDFIVKLDGDLSFSPDYFEQCFNMFSIEPDLGIGGGAVYQQLVNGDIILDSIGDPPFHVRGATKIYRNECWEKIQPLVSAPGWDTIDEVKANMHGWKTKTFSDLKIIQLKPTGGADGSWKNWFKNGRANYITGYHPFFMLLKCVKRSFQKPYLLCGLALMAGYFSSYFCNVRQIDDGDAIRFLQQQQIKRLSFKPSIYG